MPFDYNRLKGKIKAAHKDEQNETQDPDASIDRIAEKTAKAFIEEIKEMKFEYISGLTTVNGPVTGIIIYKVS